MICLLLLSGFLLSPLLVEAGLFDRIRERRKARIKANTPEVVRKPVPRHRSYYRDAHKDAYINHDLLEAFAEDDEAKRKVVVDIENQRVYLLIQDLVAVDAAVSTARRGKYTPRGSYEITEKIKSGKVSTLYHVYMPNWMRLGSSAVGMHTGDLPGYPASAGCIRLPQSVAPIIFANTRYGVQVDVVDAWEEEKEGLLVPYLKPDNIWLADAGVL